MKQYKFHDLGINKRGDPLFIPPEAMVIFNEGIGTPLEDYIDGFQTLNVTGRELLGLDIDTEKVNGTDGLMMLNASLPSREITVTYRLKAESDQIFREKYSRLAEILNEKKLVFSFYDDMQYYYEGVVSNAKIPEAGMNDVVSEFTITCPSPYKRLREATYYNERNHSIVIDEPAYIPTVPDELIVSFTSPQPHVTITNGKQQIKLTHDFVNNAKLVIHPEATLEKGAEILLNGEKRLDLLDLDSDLENFTVQHGMIVRTEPTLFLEMKLRRLSL